MSTLTSTSTPTLTSSPTDVDVDTHADVDVETVRFTGYLIADKRVDGPLNAFDRVADDY